MNQITIPDFSLVVLVGASGCGKSTFAAKQFLGTEVISSDVCRGLVSDDECSMEATGDAFELLHFIAAKRLAARRLTVIDATNVQWQDRNSLVALAREYHALPVAIVIDPGEKICQARNQKRPDRQFGPHVVRHHHQAMRRGFGKLRKQGFRQVYKLDSEELIGQTVIERQPLWTDKRRESGPFDIIGDIHGCCHELEKLLQKLGYEVVFNGEGPERRCRVKVPEGRRAVFVGDLVDRGPRTPDVLRLVMQMVADKTALCVIGNHEFKLLKYLNGKNVKAAHGLAETIEQLEAEPDEFRLQVKAFLEGLLSHYWLDDGRLAIAHAGLKESMIGRGSGKVRSFAMYGETTGEIDEFGLPVRLDWAAHYRGDAMVVHGHTPTPDAQWLNNTICIDTGCVFGGELTALRYPEKQLVSIKAARIYAEPAKPLIAKDDSFISSQQACDDVLDIAEVTGRRSIETGLRGRVSVREDKAAAALEVMSRFAVSPKWLIYLPPTMSPSETSKRGEFLEHPAEAFDYFKSRGVERVVIEEKHMGSRACIIVCQDQKAAAARFGVLTGESGCIYSRTGRAFFNDRETTELLLARLRTSLDKTGFWERFNSDWALLDVEIMPWSAKAREMIKSQYAATAVAARLGLGAAVKALEKTRERGILLDGFDDHFKARLEGAQKYSKSWQPYCWSVNSLEDYRIAPFHLLASEGKVHMDRPNSWHMGEIEKLCANDDPVLLATGYHVLDPSSQSDVEKATDWWLELTGRGQEGMVVKSDDFIAKGKRGIVQPALKCRGREYLRIIYGPEYDRPEHLVRLRQRGLGRKRSLALREFALGKEALDRFIKRQPLRRVHECVFAVLALESEPVDPRL